MTPDPKLTKQVGDPDCICQGTGLVTRLTGMGGNTGPEICDCVAKKAVAAALPAIEDSCRKRWEEELLREGPIRALDASLGDHVFDDGDLPALPDYQRALRVALQATRDGER